MQIDLVEAGEIWHTSKTIVIEEELIGGKGMGGGGDGNSLENFKKFHDWAANIRKLAPPERPHEKDGLNTYVLDCVYGPIDCKPNMRSRQGAAVLLRKFRDALQEHREVYSEYPKIRRVFFDEY